MGGLKTKDDEQKWNQKQEHRSRGEGWQREQGEEEVRSRIENLQTGVSCKLGR